MTNVNLQRDEQLRQLGEWYGDGQDGACPTSDQWRRILERPADKPITLINFFKLRESARYPVGAQPDEGEISGQDAFGRYSAVSMPTMQRVGGRFLLVGPFEGMFQGEDEDWDLVAIGSYPDLQAFLGLYTDPDYRAVFHHRTAACARQKVIVCAGG